MKFSEKLKQAMQQLGINQAQVVGLTGKSKGSISMYLNDKTTPSEQVQSDIAAVEVAKLQIDLSGEAPKDADEE